MRSRISRATRTRRTSATATGPGVPSSGFVHSHVGWLFGNLGMEQGREYGKDLYENRLVRTIDRLYLVWVVLTLGMPFLVGYAVGGTLAAGVEGLVWGGLIRIFLYQHATFSVNSICHMFGRKDYPLARRGTEQLARRTAGLRRGLAQQPPRLPEFGAPRAAPPPVRRLLVGDSRPRAARARLEREGAKRTATAQTRSGRGSLTPP